MIPSKLRFWWAKRKGYTSAMAEHYAVIAEYGWYDIKFLCNSAAIVPLLLVIAVMISGLRATTIGGASK